MPTGYTSDIYDGKDTTLAGYLRTCAPAFILDMRDMPADAPIPERSTYKDEVVANYERQEQEALDSIYRLEGMSDEQCDVEAKSEYDAALAYVTTANEKKRAMEARYRSVLAQLHAWTPPPPLTGVRDFMRDQLLQSIKFDCDLSGPPSPPLSGREWRAAQMERAQRDHTRASAELAKQREARVRGNAFMEALHAEINALAAAGPPQERDTEAK